MTIQKPFSDNIIWRRYQKTQFLLRKLQQWNGKNNMNNRDLWRNPSIQNTSAKTLSLNRKLSGQKREQNMVFLIFR